MIAAWELKDKPKPSTKPVTNPPRTGSNGRPAPLQGQLKPPSNGKVWNLPSSDALPFYRDFIQKQNKRLSFAEADRIARGVIGFSIKYGVDARLVMAMIMVESGFKPNSKSGAGAMGLGQLMPGTARELGVSNAYDSIENLSGMVRLVRSHIDRYSATTDSDYEALVLMLAAYNAGPGAVRKHGGIPPYRETQDYVRKVTSIYRQLCGE
ncbi:MAG: lytic transglycosylase domain-containing protein [Armatimonadetes bacterium]|nr:lytic transglycosylase domain-containing protein [Armatimonadota bacterium]